jgi:hypothetical protein
MVTTEFNIHLGDLVFTQTVRLEPHKSNNHGKAAISEPLIVENNAT